MKMNVYKRKLITIGLVITLVLTTAVTAFAQTPPNHFNSAKVNTSMGTIYCNRSNYGMIEGASLNVRGIPTTINGVKVSTLSTNSFAKSSKVNTFTIPKYVKKIEKQVFYKASNTSFKVSSANNYFRAKDGILYNKKMTELVAYPYKKSADTYVMPSTIKTANTRSAMGGRNLVSVYLGSNVKNVLEESFFGANKLKAIDVSPKNKYYKTASEMLLTKSGKTLVAVPAGYGRQVTIPYGVVDYKSDNLETTEVIGVPDTMKYSYLFLVNSGVFILFQNEAALKKQCDIQWLLRCKYATLTGGQITDKQLNSDGSVKLTMSSINYDNGEFAYTSIFGKEMFNKTEQNPWFTDKTFDVYRNDHKIGTVDYRTDQNSVEFIDKTPEAGKNTYYVIPKFRITPNSKKPSIPVVWYKSSKVVVNI